MARLSKADWNKLKKQIGHFKGELKRGVKWKSARPIGRPKGWSQKLKGYVKPEET